MAAAIESFSPALSDEWDLLARAVGASPFVRPGWVRAWAEAFGPGPPAVATVRRAGRLVAALPIFRDGK
ncbi:MAG: hypothetical protein ACE5KX_09080, partial [Acidimicrobiia bacterium]